MTLHSAEDGSASIELASTGALIRMPVLPLGAGQPAEFQVLFSNSGGNEIALESLRRDPEGKSELVLRCPAGIKALARLRGMDGDVFGPEILTTEPFILTIGELAAIQVDGRIVPTYRVTGGAFKTPAPPAPGNDFARWRRGMGELWPTRSYQDLTRIRLEPAGLHLEGRLPSSFFADPGASRPVVLRAPRSAADAQPVEDDALNAANPSLRGVRRTWFVTDVPFDGAAPEAAASRLTRGWIAAIGGFRLRAAAGEVRDRDTFLAELSHQPTDGREIAVLEQVALPGSTNTRLDWFSGGVQVEARIGGRGALESRLRPDRFLGSLTLAADGSLARRELALEGGPLRAGEAPTAPRIALTLSQPTVGAEPGVVRLDAGENLELQAISCAAQPLESPGAGSDSTARFRVWLCTRSGWAALDADLDPAESTPRVGAVSQGALSGQVQFDALQDLLRSRPPAVRNDRPAAPRSALRVLAQAVGSSRVSVALVDDAGQSPGSQSLELVIVNPFATVTTPAVVFDPPRPPTGAAGIGRSVLPSLSAGVGMLDPAEPAVRGLEQALAARFSAAVFISRSAIDATEERGRSTFRALLQTDDADDAAPSRFLLRIAPPGEGLPRLVVWHRPAVAVPNAASSGLPLTRTYPIDPNADRGAFLDPNRGLLPYVGVGPVDLEFPDRALAQVRNAPDFQPDDLPQRPAAGWAFADGLAAVRYFLPTAPGVELVFPAELTSEAGPDWVYRHATPVLDESYSEATEKRRDPAEPLPDAGDLPPGFDPTLAIGAVAFTLAASGHALGWRHPTDFAPPNGERAADPDGRLDFTLDQVSLVGWEPRVAITLAMPDDATATAQRVLSRTENTAGLDLPLLVDPRSGAEPLPSFAVRLAADDAPDDAPGRESIRNQGQPLLVALDADPALAQDATTRLRIQDGSGLIQVEPDAGGVTYRRVGSDQVERRVSTSDRLWGEVDLVTIGVRLGEPPLAAEPDLPQSWLLHDAGEHPLVAGFPFVAQGLLASESAGRRAYAIEGLLSPLPVDGFADPAAVGERSLTLEFVREGDGWTIAARGGVDWRFDPTSTAPRLNAASGEVRLLRLVADAGLESVAVEPGLNRLKLPIRKLVVSSPVGPVVLDFTTRPSPGSVILARNPDSGLAMATIDGIDRVEDGPFAFELGGIVLRQTAIDPRSLAPVSGESGRLAAPSRVGLEIDGPSSYTFEWSRRVTLAEFQPLADSQAWTLSYSRPSSVGSTPAWRLQMTQSLVNHLGRVESHALIDVGLIPHPAGGSKLLFLTESDAEGPPLPAASWFERIPGLSDRGMVGAEFADPRTLAALAVELQSRVRPRGGRAGRLVVRARFADSQPPALRVSGFLALENQIALRRGNYQAAHIIQIAVDDAEVPYRGLYFGLGPDAGHMPHVLTCQATHRFELGSQTLTWSVVQMVRLWDRSAFGRRFLGEPSASPANPALVIEAGWVFWLGDRAARPAGPAIPASVVDPRISDGLALRPRFLGEFDGEPGQVTRLPFADLGPDAGESPIATILLDNVAADLRRVLPRSGAMPTRRWPTPAVIDPVNSSPETRPVALLRRGPLVEWLQPAYLAGLLGQADARDLLPAFVTRVGNNDVVSNRYPTKLGDLQWINPAGQPQTRRVPAASVATPYEPGGDPIALASATVLESPYEVEPVDNVATPTAAVGQEAQLVGFAAGRLGVIQAERIEPPRDESPAQRAQQWARDALDAARRDDAAILLINFIEGSFAPRRFDAQRARRGQWSTAPPGTPQRRLGPAASGADPDPRRRPILPAADGRPVLVAPAPADRPALAPFAARPEIPPPATGEKVIAATRFRLTSAGSNGSLPDARVERLDLADLAGLPPSRLLQRAESARRELFQGQPVNESTHRIAALTSLEQTAFQVNEPGESGPAFPGVGLGPLARRRSAPTTWPAADGDDDSTQLVTVTPPLLDVVVWARRPGERTRTVWRSEAYRYDATGEGVHQVVIEQGPDLPVALRRPRAAAGPTEAVALERIFALPILQGAFEYSQFRLIQRVGMTAAPPIATVQAVVTVASDLFPGVDSIRDAATRPAILRDAPAAEQSPASLEPFGVHLVADKRFEPRLPATGEATLSRTIVIVQRGDQIPPPGDLLDPNSPDIRDGLVRLISDLPDPTEPVNDGASGPFWRPLNAATFALEIAIDRLKLQTIRTLFDGLAPQSVMLLALRYSRSDENGEYAKPEQPLSAVALAHVNPSLSLVKPKMSVTLLRPPFGETSPADRLFGFSGHGRLDDSNFTPVRPDSGPNDQVAWNRVANLQALDRVDGPGTPPASASHNGRESAIEQTHRVVFDGPGGERVPTVDVAADKAFEE